MRKRMIAGILAVVMVLATSITAFAGTWKQDAKGWQWDYGNGTKAANKWEWCDGNGDGIAECYYFDGNGYCLMNTTTPDGYTVNKDGAWTVNGVVQTKNVGAGQTAAAANNNGVDRLMYLKMLRGLPGETEAQKNAKMQNVLFNMHGIYGDMEQKPKTYAEVVKFLNETDWPNMSDYEKVEAAYKRCAVGFNGNHYGSDYTGAEKEDRDKGIYEDTVLVYGCGGCANYDGALRQLCQYMGMKTGTLGVNLHSQTMVKIDGKWWVINPSWANGEPMEKHMMLFDSDERRTQWPLYSDGTGYYLDFGETL